MLLVGYSLDDVDMRQLLSIVRDRLGKNSRPVYCVQVGASVADISRFKRRGVEVINLPRRAKESYAEVLSRFFSELRDYINKKAECLTSCTTEEGREEMIRPKANNNLCFVGCSIARAAGLKKLLGPIIRDSGAVPVWPENIVSQRVSRKNACKAVATKSAVRIFDITDANPQVLALLQIAREDNATKTIMIREVSDGANQDVLKDLPEVLYYVIDDSDLCVVEAEQARIFRSEIQKCIIDSIRYNGKSLGDVLNDAESLLKEGYYDAALLSAFAQLERVLRSDRTPALGCSIRKLCEARLQDGEMRDIDRYLSLRNSVAHGLGSASEKDVNSFVRIVRRIIDKHSVIRENSSIARRHTSARSCQIFVSITLFPWEISKGPTYNTVYPTDWASYGIPGDALLDDESFNEFVENKTALRVLDYTGRSLVNWTPREVQNSGGKSDYAFQATCSNPLDEAQTWFVTAWVRFD